MSIGDNIKKARQQAGLTQKELGEKLGITFQSVAQWETGRRTPKPATLKKIAAALGVSWYELISDDPEEQAETIKENMKQVLANLKGEVMVQEPLTENPKALDALASTIEETFSDRNRILMDFDRLNEAGQQKAVERVHELTEIPRYKRKNTPTE